MDRVLSQISKVLWRIVETDIKNVKTFGFEHLASRKVACGSEHAFRLPIGYSARDVFSRMDQIQSAVGAPVELIDRAGAVILRVVENPMPVQIGFKNSDLKSKDILIGYDRLYKPVYHPLNTHVLVGGASGSGKTDGLRFWMYQLLLQGYEIRICDLKGFSFFPFEHLPNVSVAKNIVQAHEMMVESYIQLEQRKDAVIRTRDRELVNSFRPVVLIIDEAAALAPTQNRGRTKKLAEECDEVVSFFGQQAREPKMFMIYSTQRPSREVINLQFRANCEAMIAFRCRDVENSRLIIGKEGAEQISPLTPGQCIYSMSRDHHLQVPYIGSDSAWSELLKPLRTEVIQSAERTELSRLYPESTGTRSDGQHETTGDTQRLTRFTEKSIEPAAKTRDRRQSVIELPRSRETVATQETIYSDSIE
jgi:DNA segregation ATPase FtsK/SpoIIIE, S-DNA-T family